MRTNFKLKLKLEIPLSVSPSLRSYISSLGRHALLTLPKPSTLPVSKTHSKPHLSIYNIVVLIIDYTYIVFLTNVKLMFHLTYILYTDIANSQDAEPKESQFGNGFNRYSPFIFVSFEISETVAGIPVLNWGVVTNIRFVDVF